MAVKQALMRYLITAIIATGLLVGLTAEVFRRSVKASADDQANVGWTIYNGGLDNSHYSRLSQINAENVRQLKIAWRYDTGPGGLQTNPLIIGRTLFAYDPLGGVIALDGATGKQIWKFTPDGEGLASRGFTWYSANHQSRLLAYIVNFVYALDPATGKPITSFGESGRIDLRKDLNGDYLQNSVVATTPGILYKDLLIVGFRTSESKPAPRADIRAYNVVTGKLVWSFHTIPHPGEPGYETWPAGAWTDAGAANNWCGMAVDEKRGIVYAPTGSAVSDFYGGDRAGNDLYANTLLALDAKTGKEIWHFQGVHHDIWDRDFPSPPVLLTVRHEGKTVDAIAQPTKHGFLFLFDRVTGEPLFPVTEKPFPPSHVPGEVTSPTQPTVDTPAPYARQSLTEDMLTNRTPAAHRWALEQFRNFEGGGLFVPLDVGKQTIVFPGFDGGAEWGGFAADHTGVVYINSNDIVWTGGLAENKPEAGPGSALYFNQCSPCHGEDRLGYPPAFPSLVGIANRLSEEQIATTIHNGRGRMPAFPFIAADRLKALEEFLKSGSGRGGPSEANRDFSSRPGGEKHELAPAGLGGEERYRFTGYRKFYDPDGYPAIAPPWGTLNAIDLNTGKYVWKIPLGEYPELVAQGMRNTGTENYGGPIITAGGVLFIGATIFDHKIRAFDMKTGNLLWAGDLPFSGGATPATYSIDGKQYVVIATSNARDPKGPEGSAYVAFALP